MHLEDVCVYHLVDKHKSSVIKICHRSATSSITEVAAHAYTLMPNSSLVQFWRQSDKYAVDVPLLLERLINTFDEKVLISYSKERSSHLRLKHGISYQEIQEIVTNVLSSVGLYFVHRNVL